MSVYIECSKLSTNINHFSAHFCTAGYVCSSIGSMYTLSITIPELLHLRVAIHYCRILERDPSNLVYLIERSCQNKAEVVAADEREGSSGVRATLNLGHTFGHAIEAGLGYGAWLVIRIPHLPTSHNIQCNCYNQSLDIFFSVLRFTAWRGSRDGNAHG